MFLGQWEESDESGRCKSKNSWPCRPDAWWGVCRGGCLQRLFLNSTCHCYFIRKEMHNRDALHDPRVARDLSSALDESLLLRIGSLRVARRGLECVYIPNVGQEYRLAVPYTSDTIPTRVEITAPAVMLPEEVSFQSRRWSNRWVRGTFVEVHRHVWDRYDKSIPRS